MIEEDDGMPVVERRALEYFYLKNKSECAFNYCRKYGIDDFKKYRSLCYDFAVKVTPTNNYEDGGQKDIGARINQNYIGKLGEVCLHRVLQNIYPEVNAPDFNIYKDEDKNWNPDLKINKYDIHVKTQKYVDVGTSLNVAWVLQYNKNSKYGARTDKHITNPTSRDRYFFTVINEDSGDFWLCSSLMVKDFKPMFLDIEAELHKDKTKSKVRFEDILKFKGKI